MIETDALTIRRFAAGDLEALHEVLSDARTMAFWPRPFGRDETAAWIECSLASYAEHGFGRYAVVLRDGGCLIGTSGIVRMPVDGEPCNDLGYIIHHPHWRRGLASEAAAALRDHAFAVLGLESLHANMPVEHHGSRRVAERIGMRRIKTFRNPRNRDRETYLYGLSRPD